MTTPFPRYLLELDCEGDPAWDCITNMFLWVLRLLYTSKEDLQFPQNDRLAGELAALPGSLAPAHEPLPPSLPPRARSMGKEGHSRTISDASYASTSSYGSQSTGTESASPESCCCLCLFGLFVVMISLLLFSCLSDPIKKP